MIGKKTNRNKDDEESSEFSDINYKKDKKGFNKNKEGEKNNKIKNYNNTTDKKGLNIRELKEKIKNNKNFEENNDKKLNEDNKPKYTKLDSSSSSSESSDEEKEKEKEKNINKKEKKVEENIKENKDDKKKKNEEKNKNEKSHPEFTKSTKVNYTLSILIPSSIVDNAQSKELRTYLIGELARTIGIFKISEVIIFHDKLKDNSKDYINYFIKNLQYLETPQYLRKTLFPMSEDLKLSGLMNPLVQ